MDGTFAVCPSLFYQLYTMHGVIKDTTVPLVYCLLRSKTKEKYEEMFAALKNLNAMLDPHEVTIDFEIAAIEALKSSFPKANIKGCFFHLARAIKGSLGYVHPTIFKLLIFCDENKARQRTN